MENLKTDSYVSELQKEIEALRAELHLVRVENTRLKDAYEPTVKIQLKAHPQDLQKPSPELSTEQIPAQVSE